MNHPPSWNTLQSKLHLDREEFKNKRIEEHELNITHIYHV
jgi:hypothetical protein